MTYWGAGLEGQRLPDHRVAVTEETRHGRATRHTFAIAKSGQWVTMPDIPKLLERSTRRGYGRPSEPADLSYIAPKPSLPEKVVLADDFTVSSSALTVILDALALNGRHRVDLGDIKRVVSQLGPRLTALETLPDDKRRLAAPALYAQILSRCTTV